MIEQKPKKKVRRRRPESIFLSDFGRSWKAAGGHWYKIPDASGVLSRFANPRPFDVYAAIGGLFFTIEAKYVKSHLFSLRDMRPHQIPELWAARQAGYQAFVLVCYERLGGKVADFYDVETLMAAQKSGKNLISAERSRLRVYCGTKGQWEISAAQMQKMCQRSQPEDLFTKKE